MDVIVNLVPKIKLGCNVEDLERVENRKNKLIKAIFVFEEKRKNILLYRLKLLYNIYLTREGKEALELPNLNKFYQIIKDT
jgi:hypothetical protein